MKTESDSHPLPWFKKYKNAIQSAFVILSFFIAIYGKGIVQAFTSTPFESDAGKIAYSYSWWLLPVLICTGFLFGFKNVLRELRIHKGFFIALLFSVIAVLPMMLGSAVLGKLADDIDAGQLFHKTLAAGFMEELLFRGFLFGILFRKLTWGFIPAAILGAVVFGIGHLYQGKGTNEAIAVFAITGIGALWFSWLFIEWEENLWIPVMLHILMNLSWALFEISPNAIGGFGPNIFRMLTIAITVIATIRYCRNRQEFRINRNTLFRNRQQVKLSLE